MAVPYQVNVPGGGQPTHIGISLDQLQELDVVGHRLLQVVWPQLRQRGLPQLAEAALPSDGLSQIVAAQWPVVVLVVNLRINLNV